MPDFTGYPSSLTGAGTTQYHLGVIPVSNITNYQELKDNVTGYGTGVGDTTIASFNSAAKYPTDVNIGGPLRAVYGSTGAALGASTFEDLQLAIDDFVAIKSDWDTAVASISAFEKRASTSLSKLSYSNVQSKLELVNFELKRLIADISLVNLGGANYTANGGVAVTTTVGRYPSSWNRFQNTNGGA